MQQHILVYIKQLILKPNNKNKPVYAQKHENFNGGYISEIISLDV
jgi:hypothetical protein